MEQSVSLADRMKFMLFLFFPPHLPIPPAPGAYCQVPAPLTQWSGAEELHEHSGKSGTER